MEHKSLAKTFAGTVKCMLGTWLKIIIIIIFIYFFYYS